MSVIDLSFGRRARPAVTGVLVVGAVLCACATSDAAGPVGPADDPKLQRLWKALAEADAAEAYRAVRALAEMGPKAVAFLKGELKPVGSFDAAAIERAIAKLDDPKVAVRQRAFRDLSLIGIAVEEAMHKALRTTKSAEVEVRLKQLVADAYSPVPTTAPARRRLRAIRVLARAGTPEARAVLAALAAGAPKARATRQAASALRRLGEGRKTDSPAWWLGRAEEEAELWGNAYQRAYAFAEIAKLLAEAGRIKAALEMDRRIDHAPAQLSARYRIAAAYARAGDLKAAKEFARLIHFPDGHAEAQCHIAIALAKIGRTKDAEWLAATAGRPPDGSRPGGNPWRVPEGQLKGVRARIHAAIAAAHAAAGRREQYRKHIERAEALAKSIPGDIGKMMAKMGSSAAPSPPGAINAIYKSNAIESVILARARAEQGEEARRPLGLLPAGRYRDARARHLVQVLIRRGDLKAARDTAEAITTEDHRELAYLSMVEAYVGAGQVGAAKALAGRIRRPDNAAVAKMHLASVADQGRALRAAAATGRLRGKTYRALARVPGGTASRSRLPAWIDALGGAEPRYYAFVGAAEGTLRASDRPAPATRPARPEAPRAGSQGDPNTAGRAGEIAR